MQTLSTLPPKFTLPTIFVILGITGDLVKKKILKALYDLYLKKRLPERFRVYGFSRRDYSDLELRAYLKSIMTDGAFEEEGMFDEFLSTFYYVGGDFTEPSAYEKLASMLGRIDGEWSICSNKLFYLAVPPQSYSDIITNLHASGLTDPCSEDEGWTRVILEKPFGTDRKTAIALDAQLGSLFKEEQIYRVDHYLAKETVRNIVAFRFSNVFLEPVWNNNYIEKIEVKLLEKQGVSNRGNFYDKVGALRDVGQNHLLQLLALFIMDEPAKFEPDEIKKERADALSSLQILTPQDVETRTTRGQYKGYRQERGVIEHSNTETYFKITAFSDKHDFRGIPLIIESGKSMDRTCTEVVVTFKPSTSPFNKDRNVPHNMLQYQLLPKEKISMCFLSKQPGFEYVLQAHELGFDYHQAYKEDLFVNDYEALLYDIVRGDQTLFVSTNEIMSEWAFIEPIINEWHHKNNPELTFYEKES